MSLDSKIRKILSFNGPVVATVTPINEDGSVNESLDDITSYVSYLSTIGVQGVYVHGTTGEGVSLNHDVKKRLTQNWIKAVKQVNPRILTIINVSSCCVDDSKDHAKMCEELDVDGIAVLPPFYYRPSNIDQLVSYMEVIASAAPTIPLFFYHFPEMTKVDLPIIKFIDKTVDAVKSFCGLKFTSRNISELADIRRMHGDRIKLFVGYEDSILSALVHGLDSAICAQFNFEESILAFNRIRFGLIRGDLKIAQEGQEVLVQQAHQLADGKSPR